MRFFKFSCPWCGQHIEVVAEMAGITIDCPSCRNSLRVPNPDRPAAASRIHTPADQASSPSATRRRGQARNPILARIVGTAAVTALLLGIIATPILVGLAIPVLRDARARVDALNRQHTLLTQTRPKYSFHAASPQTKPVSLGQSVLIDGVRITPLQARLTALHRQERADTAGATEHRYLVIDVSLENTLPAKVLYLRDVWVGARLIDSQGRVDATVLPGTTLFRGVAGHVNSVELGPGEIFRNIMIFAPPAPAAAEYRIEANPGIWEQIDPDMIRQVSDTPLVLTIRQAEIQGW
jgi:hypothetical protein